MEDLWAFNEEIVARAIFECSVPVISAVGHETDYTIADYVADLRAPTPSAAAELAVFDYEQVRERLDMSAQRMFHQMKQRMEFVRGRIREYQLQLKALHPKNQLLQKRQYLTDLEEELERQMQEFLQKKELYVKNAEINFIGHLQSNKIKYIIDSVTMIQSADSIALAGEISKQAEKHGKVMDILCEVNIGGEESKSGFSPEEIYEAVPQIAEMKGVRLCGLMTIPPPGQSCVYFEKMQRIFEDLKAKNADIKLLSMGMSADYTDAVRFGTGMVRLGTALFGARSYPARSSL